MEPRSEAGSNRLMVAFRALEPGEDVNEDDLAAAGDDWQSAPLFANFWLGDKRDKHKAAKFLNTVGIQTSGRGWAEVADMVKGSGFEVAGYVKAGIDEDGEPKNDDVKGFFPADQFTA